MNRILDILDEISSTLSDITERRRKELNISSLLIDLEILLNQLCYQLLVERYKGVNLLKAEEFKIVEKTAIGITVSGSTIGRSDLCNKLVKVISQMMYIDEVRVEILIGLLDIK